MIAWLSLVLTAAWAPPPEPAAADRIVDFARVHRRTQLTGMGVLTGWALANIGGGLAGSYLDPDRRFFHQGNAIWNSVNLAIGIAGLIGNTRKRVPADLARAERLNRKTARTYLINGAIDVVYIAAGAATIAIGQHYDQRRVQGYGEAIAFQGAFLFAFDTAMVLAHTRVRERWLRPSADIRGSSASLSLTGRF